MLIVWNVTQNAPLDLSRHGAAWKTDVISSFKFQRRLPCQTCGKSFDRPSLLKRHLRTHTGKFGKICDEFMDLFLQSFINLSGFKNSL